MLALALTPPEATALLADLTRDPDADALRDDAVLDELIALVPTPVGHGVTCALEARLGAYAVRYQPLSMLDLAQLWAHERTALRGLPLAALVWHVASDDCPLYRALEARLAAHITLTALRSFCP